MKLSTGKMNFTILRMIAYLYIYAVIKIIYNIQKYPSVSRMERKNQLENLNNNDAILFFSFFFF